MRALVVVVGDPIIQIGLQLFDAAIYLAPERDLVELLQNRFAEALADAVGLRMADLGLCVLNVVQCEIELIIMGVGLPQNSVPRSVNTRTTPMPCSSMNGSTRSFNRSAAVIGVLVLYSFAAAHFE